MKEIAFVYQANAISLFGFYYSKKQNRLKFVSVCFLSVRFGAVGAAEDEIR